VKNYEHYMRKNFVVESVNYTLKIKLYTCSENMPALTIYKLPTRCTDYYLFIKYYSSTCFEP